MRFNIKLYLDKNADGYLDTYELETLFLSDVSTNTNIVVFGWLTMVTYILVQGRHNCCF